MKRLAQTRLELAGAVAWRGCFLAVVMSMAACTVPVRQDGSAAPAEAKPPTAFVQLPLVPGWYDGHRVHYITTDASDRNAAKDAGANYAPRLESAIPDSPRAPGQRTVLERIYAVTNFKQDSILPSAPVPVGHESADAAYSPLWLVHRITWLPGTTPRVLRSEEEVLDAEEKKLIAIAPTRIIKNCPVIFSARDGLLRGATLIGDVR